MCGRGLFMNKYIFPGADASCALNWVIGKVSTVLDATHTYSRGSLDPSLRMLALK